MEKLKIYKNIPYLEVITGSMFSGKSQEINRRLIYIDHYNMTRKQLYGGSNTISYIILRPMTDSRPSSVRSVPYEQRNWIYVYANDLFASIPAEELLEYDYIVLDEAQFFTEEIISQVKLLLSNHKYVLISGLDKDYRGNPFSEFMKWALCQADDVTKLTAVCGICGAPATMAKLIVLDGSPIPADSNIIIEDDNHKYVPMCRRCMLGSIK